MTIARSHGRREPRSVGAANNFARQSGIIVGIDGSVSAVYAARWAAREAAGRNLPITLLHVLPRHAHPDNVFGAPAVDKDFAGLVLAKAAAAIAATGLAVSVRTETVVGDPVRALNDASHRAQILVVGSTGASSLERLWLGSTAASIAESAECVVVVVRGQSDTPHGGGIVVGVGTADVQAAGNDPDPVVSEAFRSAAAAGVDVIGVRGLPVVESIGAGGFPVTVPSSISTVADRMSTVGVDFPNVRVATTVLEVSLSSELVHLSRRARLVVVGHRHGRTAGPTLRALLRRSQCPVMIVQHS